MTTLDKNPYAAHAPPTPAPAGGENFDYDYYDPHCFFSSGLAQNRRRLGFIATCSSVQCKTGGSEGKELYCCKEFNYFRSFDSSYLTRRI